MNDRSTVFHADRAWHVYNSINQFSLSARRHRLVERMECLLVEPLSLDELFRRVAQHCSIRHELALCARDQISELLEVADAATR